jgi:hypothetical protein
VFLKQVEDLLNENVMKINKIDFARKKKKKYELI